MIDNKIIIGISQGDVNGIGLEVILKTLMEPAMYPYPFQFSKNCFLLPKNFRIRRI